MKQQAIKNDYQRIYNDLKDKKSWDYIDSLNLTTQKIETKYKNMILDVTKKEKDKFIEEGLKISPSMVGCFYYFIDLYKKIPTQREFIKFYYSINSNWIREKVGKTKHYAFLGRLSRFYPSMLRDFHFYHFLKESGKFEKVLFTLKYDFEGKVDVFVKKNKEWFGVQLRTNTKRSTYFYHKKPKRNAIELKIKKIDLPIELSTAKSINTKKDSLKLYGHKELKTLLNEIEKVKNKKTVY